MARAAGDALDATEVVNDDEPAAERQLSRGETVLWYGLAGVTYVGASIFEKGLLNWFVGPAWLVAFIWGGPALTDALRARFGRRRRSAAQ
jgi:energy-converting hydrogenase Eha subunit G